MSKRVVDLLQAVEVHKGSKKGIPCVCSARPPIPAHLEAPSPASKHRAVLSQDIQGPPPRFGAKRIRSAFCQFPRKLPAAGAHRLDCPLRVESLSRMESWVLQCDGSLTSVSQKLSID